MRAILEFLFVVVIYGLLIIEPSESATIKTLNKHQKLVIISFDGFRSDYLGQVTTPVLDGLVKNGVSVPYMRSQFSTKTFPNHQSLATGLFTESHGIVDNSVFDPEHNRSLSGFDSYNDPFWNFHENVVPIWILNEWAGDGRISGVQFPGANQEYGQNRSLPTHWLSYDGSRPYETRMDIVYDWLTNATHPANLVFMYFEQPDTAGHDFGPNSEQVRSQIRNLDKMTGYLIDMLKASGIYEDVNIMLWSDHGMQEVNVGNRINLTEIVQLDRSLYVRYGSSPVWHLLPKPGEETRVYDAFKAASVGRKFSVYMRDEVPERWHYQNNRRIMPIIVVSDPGYVFEDFKPTVVNTTLKFGVHGYDNAAESMNPFFIAHGPAFKNGFKAEPFDNVDLFPLIAYMMEFNLAPNSNNGTLNSVSSILTTKTTTTTTTAITTTTITTTPGLGSSADWSRQSSTYFLVALIEFRGHVHRISSIPACKEVCVYPGTRCNDRIADLAYTSVSH